MAWAYFFFNDYLVPWYGGNKFEKLLLDFHAHGPFACVWVSMLICNIVIPWAILWNKKWRRTPWLMLVIGIVINIGMWIERFVIIPVSLTITRMPFTWRLYTPMYRNSAHDWYFRLVHAAVYAGLPADPVGAGLGSPGRTERPHPAQGWESCNTLHKRS